MKVFPSAVFSTALGIGISLAGVAQAAEDEHPLRRHLLAGGAQDDRGISLAAQMG